MSLEFRRVSNVLRDIGGVLDITKSVIGGEQWASTLINPLRVMRNFTDKANLINDLMNYHDEKASLRLESRRSENESLIPYLYSYLVENHWFSYSTGKVPGTYGFTCVEYRGVQVAGMSFPTGVRVDVRIPFMLMPDKKFDVAYCGEKFFLMNRRGISLRRDNFSSSINKILDLSEHGAKKLEDESFLLEGQIVQ